MRPVEAAGPGPAASGSRGLLVGSTERPAITARFWSFGGDAWEGTLRGREIWPESATHGRVRESPIQFDSRRLHHFSSFLLVDGRSDGGYPAPSTISPRLSGLSSNSRIAAFNFSGHMCIRSLEKIGIGRVKSMDEA